MKKKKLTDGGVEPIIKVSPSFTKGELIQYYREGWRAGYIESIGKNIKVRPVGAYKAGKPHLVAVAVEDLRKVYPKFA